MSYVDANGVHSYYEEHGSGDPLLLLHGGLIDGDSFAQQTPIVAQHYRVIVPAGPPTSRDRSPTS